MRCLKYSHLTGMGAVMRSMGQGSVFALNLSMVRCTNAGRPHESCWRKGTLGEVSVSRRVCRHRCHSHLHKPNELPSGQKRGSQAPRGALDLQHIFSPRQHCGYKHDGQIRHQKRWIRKNGAKRGRFKPLSGGINTPRNSHLAAPPLARRDAPSQRRRMLFQRYPCRPRGTSDSPVRNCP